MSGEQREQGSLVVARYALEGEPRAELAWGLRESLEADHFTAADFHDLVEGLFDLTGAYIGPRGEGLGSPYILRPETGRAYQVIKHTDNFPANIYSYPAWMALPKDEYEKAKEALTDVYRIESIRFGHLESRGQGLWARELMVASVGWNYIKPPNFANKEALDFLSGIEVEKVHPAGSGSVGHRLETGPLRDIGTALLNACLAQPGITRG